MATAEELKLRPGEPVRYKGIAPFGTGIPRLVNYVGEVTGYGEDGAVLISSSPYTRDRVVTHVLNGEGGIVPAYSSDRPHLLGEGEEFLHLVTADNPNLHPFFSCRFIIQAPQCCMI